MRDSICAMMDGVQALARESGRRTMCWLLSELGWTPARPLESARRRTPGCGNPRWRKVTPKNHPSSDGLAEPHPGLAKRTGMLMGCRISPSARRTRGRAGRAHPRWRLEGHIGREGVIAPHRAGGDATTNTWPSEPWTSITTLPSRCYCPCTRTGDEIGRPAGAPARDPAAP